MADASLLIEIADDIEKALVHLDRYEQYITEAEPLFNLEDVRLELLCRSHPGWLAKYFRFEQELKGIENTLTIKKEELEGKLWKRYVEGYSRQLSNTDIKNYIAAEKDIVSINLIMNEVLFVKNKMSAVVEGFRQMGWSLRNIVQLRVNQLQEDVL